MTSRSLIDMNHYLEQGPTYEGHSSFVNQIPFITVPTSQSSGPTYEGHCSFVNQISFIIVPTSQNSGPTKELRPQEFPLIGTSPQNYDQETKVIVLFSVKYHLSQLLWSQFFFQSNIICHSYCGHSSRLSNFLINKGTMTSGALTGKYYSLGFPLKNESHGSFGG